MKLTLFAYSRRGCATARRIMAVLPGDWCACAPERLAEPDFTPMPKGAAALYGQRFADSDALIFVGSCGIAVREIAPWVRSKCTDPAVLCVDERGGFVIPLLSGHIGGANALARRLAAALQATAVITTATDINGRFSADAWAAENGMIIDDMAAAKAVSAAILEGDVPLKSDFPLASDLPAGTVPGERGPLGIYVTCTTARPFDRTLRLIPRCLHLGIGCRRGTESGAIAAAVDGALSQSGLDPRAVKDASSIDLKAEEPGLLAFCRSRDWPVRFYSAGELEQVPGDFTPSDFVRSVTGVDNVCERAALAGGGRLIVRKTAADGVTVAVALEETEVRFG